MDLAQLVDSLCSSSVLVQPSPAQVKLSIQIQAYSLIPGRLKQENREFKASLNYTMRPRVRPKAPKAASG